MKREFLQNLKVGEAPLPKEVIDAIMAENGRDIQQAKDTAVQPYADYDDLKGQLATANTTIQTLKAQQGDGLVDGKTAQQWKETHDQAVAGHAKELEGIKFQHTLEQAITGAKGRNAKAIAALLDVDALRESEDQAAAIKDALDNLKKDNGYLFDNGGTPPPYAPGTGGGGNPAAATNTLAGALREKMGAK